MFGFLKNRRLNRTIDAALADGVLSKNELAAIAAEAKAAGLDSKAVTALLAEKIRPVAQAAVDGITARVVKARRLTPADEAELAGLRDRLHLGVDISVTQLLPYKFLWQIENGIDADPPELPSPIRLADGETCHFVAGAAWHQWKTVREHRGYAGASVRFRVAKGVSVGFGRAVPVAETREELKLVSDGVLVITSRRFAFVGNRRSTEIRLAAVGALIPYADALEIQKTRGVPEIFLMEGHEAELAHGIGNALADRGG